MNIIVNVDKNWAIGKENKLLFPISEDLKNFKRLTINKAVIMGRATLESLPGSKPLKNRKNIVLSRTLNKNEDFYVCKDIEELKELLNSKDFEELKTEDIFVIGGQTIYRELLDSCDTAIITKVQAEAQNPDAFFPNLDKNPDWFIFEESEKFYQEDLEYSFVTYKKKQVF